MSKIDVKIGDIYVRNADGKVYRVKKIDEKKIVLESDRKDTQIFLDMFVLERAYTKKEPTQ